MNRRFLLAILLAVPAGAPLAAQSPALPAAASILDRYVEATGGAAAYEGRTSEITRGTMEYAAAGIKGTLVRYAAAPDRYHATIDIPGAGAMEMGLKDGVAWDYSLMLGAHIRTGAERAELVREATLNSSLRWRDLYKTVQTTGVDSVNGEECYQVTLTPPEGAPEVMCFSKQSGLGLKVSTTAASQLGEVPVEVTISDYKNFGGILAPARITQRAGGQEMVISIDSVEVNPEIPAARFDLPAEVQVLLARQARDKAKQK